jgi:uncharacterized membrane protein
MSIKTVLRIVFGIFMIVAGIMHFVRPDFYARIMPPILPFKAALVAISGVAEMLLGAGLIVPRTQRISAWGLVALLVAVYPANIYMAVEADHFRDIAPSNWFHIIRLPLQFVMIGLCVWFALPEHKIAKRSEQNS